MLICGEWKSSDDTPCIHMRFWNERLNFLKQEGRNTNTNTTVILDWVNSRITQQIEIIFNQAELVWPGNEFHSECVVKAVLQKMTTSHCLQGWSSWTGYDMSWETVATKDTQAVRLSGCKQTPGQLFYLEEEIKVNSSIINQILWYKCISPRWWWCCYVPGSICLHTYSGYNVY